MRAPTIRAPRDGMNRRIFRWAGLLVLALNGALVALFGVEDLVRVDVAVQFTLGVLSGLLLVLSSVDLPWDVPWYRLAGLGYVCFAVWMLLTLLASNDAIWWRTVAVLNALVVTFVGVDVARGGRHFDVRG